MRVPVIPWQVRMLLDVAVVAVPFYFLCSYPYGLFTRAEEHNRRLRKHDFVEVQLTAAAAARVEAVRQFYAQHGFEDCV